MQRYTKTAMLLHWLTALLIISAFFLGLVMTDIHGITPTKLKYYSWHKWLGITVLAQAGQHAGVAKPGRRRHARAALPPDLRRAAVGLFLHLRRRRAGGLPRPVPAAVADRAESRTETAAPGRALLADHDHGRPCRRPRPGRPQAPLHRPRRRPQAHAAQSLIPP